MKKILISLVVLIGLFAILFSSKYNLNIVNAGGCTAPDESCTVEKNGQTVSGYCAYLDPYADPPTFKCIAYDTGGDGGGGGGQGASCCSNAECTSGLVCDKSGIPAGNDCSFSDGYKGVCVLNAGGGLGDAAAQTGLNQKCNCGIKTFGACGNILGLTNVKYRGPCIANTTGPHICNAKVGTTYYQYQSCAGGGSPTLTPGGPTATPTPTGIAGTPSPTPTTNPACTCNALDACSNQCTFNKITDITTYNNPIKCQAMASARYASAPTAANKTDWCRRPKRVQGDADGNDVVTIMDYFYLVSGQFGGKIPARINVDFNGDGTVNGEDRVVIIKGLAL